MKKRLFLTLLVLAVLVLALPGVATKIVRGVTGQPRRLARRLPGSHSMGTGEPAGLVTEPTPRKRTAMPMQESTVSCGIGASIGETPPWE
jgi:hypothetical protein